MLKQDIAIARIRSEHLVLHRCVFSLKIIRLLHNIGYTGVKLIIIVWSNKQIEITVSFFILLDYYEINQFLCTYFTQQDRNINRK